MALSKGKFLTHKQHVARRKKLLASIRRNRKSRAKAFAKTKKSLFSF